jgi:protein-tyrosine phosphatase
MGRAAIHRAAWGGRVTDTTIDGALERVLPWEGCYNARDLGGYPTRSGDETRWGRVVRMDNMAALTEAGRAAVSDYDVRAIIDLRKPEEIEAHPNPFATPNSHHIRYTNISLVDPAATLGEFTTLADDYKRILDTFRPQMARIMKAIADEREGAVLVHCMAGKDRTGLVSALLLDLAEVPRQIIGEDYALTVECLKPLDEQWLRNGPGDRKERERHFERLKPRAEVILEVLEHVDRRHGSVEGYLLEGGVNPDGISALRRRLLT